MKRKSKKVVAFIRGLHEFITSNPQFRRDTKSKSETTIQTELRPLIIRYLEQHFESEGYSDYTAKAHQSFYWEGQEGKYGRERSPLFGTRNYPDFIITDPYLIAIEYKQSQNGSLVKHGMGQSMMHTMCGDFDFVYYLFHDQNKDKRIEKASRQEKEQRVLKMIWEAYNVAVKFI